jgi:hypothetical protein
LAAGSNGDNEIALPVSASFQLEPDRHGSVVKLSGCVGPARKEAEWPALDRGLCQQTREAWQELLPWSDELPGDHDDDEEQQKGERDPSPPESSSGSRAILPQARLSRGISKQTLNLVLAITAETALEFPGFSGDAGSFRVRWCLPVTGQRTIGPSP